MECWHGKAPQRVLKQGNQWLRRSVKITIIQEVLTKGQPWVQTCQRMWEGSEADSGGVHCGVNMVVYSQTRKDKQASLSCGLGTKDT